MVRLFAAGRPCGADARICRTGAHPRRFRENRNGCNFAQNPCGDGPGAVGSAAGRGGVAHIARDDLARAAATALADGQDGHRVFTLSGARAWTTDEIAAAVARATGKPLAVVPVPVEALVQGMVDAGLPESVAQVFASFDTNTAAGRVATVTGDYRALTGRDPRPFEDWLAENAPALAALAG